MPSTRTSPQPDPPPWGVLIARARAARGLSPEAAAEKLLIDLTGSRWRQIEAGYVNKRGEWHKTAWNDDTTIAHMAYVVHVSPEQLEDAGRDEAAEILREIQRQEQEAAEPTPDDAEDNPEEIIRELNDLTARVERMLRRRSG